jgi:hypothetical protein
MGNGLFGRTAFSGFVKSVEEVTPAPRGPLQNMQDRLGPAIEGPAFVTHGGQQRPDFSGPNDLTNRFGGQPPRPDTGAASSSPRTRVGGPVGSTNSNAVRTASTRVRKTGGPLAGMQARVNQKQGKKNA